MRYLPSPEHHGELHLVALPEKHPRVSHLEIEVVYADARPELDLLHVNHVLFLLGRLGCLVLLVTVLPVIHDLDHGRAGRRGNLYEIQPPLNSFFQRFFHRHHTKLITPVGNHPHGADANLAVHTCAGFALWCLPILVCQ